VEDCHWGRGTGGVDVGVGLACAGMVDVEAPVVCMVAGIGREGFKRCSFVLGDSGVANV